MRGYAQKLAAEMGGCAVALANGDADYLLDKAARDGPPTVLLGAGAGVNWPAAGYETPHLLKARPYQDQHGEGPSMHPLTLTALEAARVQAHSLWGALPAPVLLVCVANPHWLAGEGGAVWAQRVARLAAQSGAGTLCITDSPRTNPLLWQAWQAQLTPPEGCRLLSNSCHAGENHYLPMLALADAVVILGSSRSMAGEAALRGCPVCYAADAPEAQQRFFTDAETLMGRALAARFQPLADERPITWRRFEPFDVTSVYVRRALAAIEAAD